MQRRDFLKMLPLTAVAPAVKPEAPKLKWSTHYCQSGTCAGQNLRIAQTKAKALNCEVRFVFNYDRHFSVMPDGTYEFQDAKWES